MVVLFCLGVCCSPTITCFDCVVFFTTLPPPHVTAATGNFAWKPADRAMTLAVLAQSLATLRCCSMARDVIILADIFEEEDFYPSTFGFRLSPPVEDESLTDLLDLAEEAVQEQVPYEAFGKPIFCRGAC